MIGTIKIREAIPSDAKKLLNHLQKIALETGYMTMGSEGPGQTIEAKQKEIKLILESDVTVLLVALDKEEIIGIAEVHGNKSPKLKHIGDISISIAKDYWGIGLGTMMMEQLIEWANSPSSHLKRVELTVQARNERARHLYEKMGFKLEAIMPRGVKDEDDYLDVCLMSMMIGEI
ncbi:GNAT family protein [Carnobacterium sp. ISL-102]|uniref:GNAT family N-acetyltransferase n=1 Tax=Carnobacterium sp. ISL-102 TaxID=2819142 RepID=UPI001BED04DE|nr:GNAT family protein [Carnobacterium sp. ISL-102]MBT2731964.1 GNAT family N-acetyltransferase [Carnobacterium sp. ISL-102]